MTLQIWSILSLQLAALILAPFLNCMIKIYGFISSVSYNLFKLIFSIFFQNILSVICGLERFPSVFLSRTGDFIIRIFCENTSKLLLKNICLFFVVKFC